MNDRSLIKLRWLDIVESEDRRMRFARARFVSALDASQNARARPRSALKRLPWQHGRELDSLLAVRHVWPVMEPSAGRFAGACE